MVFRFSEVLGLVPSLRKICQKGKLNENISVGVLDKTTHCSAKLEPTNALFLRTKLSFCSTNAAKRC